MLSDFYEQADIEDLWQRSQPALDHMIEVYHSPVAKMVFEISTYYRMPLSGIMGRRFQIYVDALGPPNYVQGRAYGDAYFVILTPSVETRIQDMRHSFLRFCVDPIGTKYGLALMEKRSLLDIAVSAPALPEIYKSDFVLLATESLIKATEARLDRTPQDRQRRAGAGFRPDALLFRATPSLREAAAGATVVFSRHDRRHQFADGKPRGCRTVKFAAAPTSNWRKRLLPSAMPKPAVASPAGKCWPGGGPV